eukprot:gene13247-457_t
MVSEVAGLRERVQRAARRRAVSAAELADAAPLDVARGIAAELGRLRLPLTTAMVVRDTAPVANYAPRPPSWRPLVDPADGGAAGEILLSCLLSDLKLPSPPDTGGMGVLKLDCVPCGSPETVTATIRCRVGRHAVCTVAAYARAPLHAFLISPVVLVFPVACPDDALHDPHVALNPDQRGAAGDLLGSFSAPLSSVLAPCAGDSPPTHWAAGLPIHPIGAAPRIGTPPCGPTRVVRGHMVASSRDDSRTPFKGRDDADAPPSADFAVDEHAGVGNGVGNGAAGGGCSRFPTIY